MSFIAIVLVSLIWHSDGSASIAHKQVHSIAQCKSLGTKFMLTTKANQQALQAVGASYKCEVFMAGIQIPA